MEPGACEQIARRLRSARSVCASTGAGMSAESGVPTFRDAQTGYWSRFNPEQLATLQAFERDPKFVWAWYRERRSKLGSVQPHVGHRLLAEWEQRIADFTLVTQNVDGLHHSAGSRNVVELHGRLDVARCTACQHKVVGLDDLGEDPHCAKCSKRLRPGVVWFGEMLPPGALEAAFDAVQRCDVLLVIGTSGVVQPAASLADAAKMHGAFVAEINPNPTPLSDVADVCLRSACAAALQAIEDAWQQAIE